MDKYRFPVMSATLQQVAAGHSLDMFDSILFVARHGGEWVEILSLLAQRLAGGYQVIARNLTDRGDDRWLVLTLEPETQVVGIICQPAQPVIWDWWALDAIERITTDRKLSENE